MVFIDWSSIWSRIKRKNWWLESTIDQLNHKEAFRLGDTGPSLLRRAIHLRGNSAFWHKHVMGNTGSGKSELLKQLMREFIAKHVPFSLVDPHSDLAESMLGHLLRSGTLDQYYNPTTGEWSEELLQKFVYIDFGIKNKQGQISHFLPYNILKQPYTPGEIGEDIVEVLFRLYPYLEQSSPQMTDIVKNAVAVMIANDLPIVKIQSVLKNKPYREGLLQNVDDPAVIEYFRYRFDEWDARYAPQMVESSLNKFSNILSSDVLRYSVGQERNSLNFETIINDGISVIFDLGGLRRQYKRLLGCLITLGMENAMYGRDGISEWERKDYFFIIDEFKLFINTAEDAVDTFLSEARKFKVWLILANQYLGQLTPELSAALQNTHRLVLKLEDDAIDMAQRVGRYFPDWNKRQPEDEEARKRTNSVAFNPNEEYELLANDIKDLIPGEGFIRYGHKLEKFKATYVPEPKTIDPKLVALKQWYADKLMVSRQTAVPMVNALFATHESTQKADIFADRERLEMI